MIKDKVSIEVTRSSPFDEEKKRRENDDGREMFLFDVNNRSTSIQTHVEIV